MATLRACTYNIRCDTDEDDRPWAARKDDVVDELERIDPDVIALQEAIAHQYDDVRSGLSGYDWHGVGRQDGERGGELVPVAWRSGRLEALETGVYWLSETPMKPSTGWDASLPRIATWALLDVDGSRLWAVSTHFDHVGREARRESAPLLAGWARDRMNDGASVLILGDLNCGPSSAPYASLREAGLEDAHEVAHERSGPRATYHGFTGSPLVRIDYAWVSPDVTVERYHAVPPASSHRSDHLPVVVDCSF